MNWFTQERLANGVWLALGLAGLVLLYLLSPILAPFALAAILAYLLAPGCAWLQRRGLPGWVAALSMMLAAMLVVAGLLLTLLPLLEREASALAERLPQLVERFNRELAPRLQAWLGVNLRLDAGSLRALAAHGAGDQDLLRATWGQFQRGGAAVFGLLGALVLVPVVLFYLLLDGAAFLRALDEVVPPRWRAPTDEVATEIDAVMAQFLRGQLAVMVALAAYYALALSLAGFDSALPIGMLTGLLVFIPYLGFTLGLLLALAAALLQFDGWYGPGMVALVYGLGQALEGFVLTPRLVGKRIGLHPLAVIFALLAFGQVFGFFGVLLALPASAVLLVALRRLKRAWLASAFYLRP